MSRLNDTNALSVRPSREGGEITRSVRKIDNGFLIRESSFDEKTGDYKCSEQYSKDVPGAEASPRSGVGQETLSDTKRYLGSDV